MCVCLSSHHWNPNDVLFTQHNEPRRKMEIVKGYFLKKHDTVERKRSILIRSENKMYDSILSAFLIFSSFYLYIMWYATQTLFYSPKLCYSLSLFSNFFSSSVFFYLPHSHRGNFHFIFFILFSFCLVCSNCSLFLFIVRKLTRAFHWNSVTVSVVVFALATQVIFILSFILNELRSFKNIFYFRCVCVYVAMFNHLSLSFLLGERIEYSLIVTGGSLC